MAIRLTESDLRKMNRRNKASMIIKEDCNRLIRKNKSITYNQLFDTISETSNKLHLKGVRPKYINEGIMDTLGSFFSSTPGGFIETLKEKVFGWILPKIGIEGELLEFMKIALANIPIKEYTLFLSPLKNCEKIADLMTDGIVEYVESKLLKKIDFGGGVFSDTVRNALSDTIDKEFIQSLQDKLNPVICGKIRSAFGSNAEEEVGEVVVGTSMG